jgi:hypothetical protein
LRQRKIEPASADACDFRLDGPELRTARTRIANGVPFSPARLFCYAGDEGMVKSGFCLLLPQLTRGGQADRLRTGDHLLACAIN